MNQPPQPNIENCAFAHSIVNYLGSCYQGKFAYLNVLGQLGVSQADENDLAKLRSILTEVRRWQDATLAGTPIFETSWTKPETFEAERAMHLLKQLNDEFKAMAKELDTVIGAEDLVTSTAKLGYLVAVYCRSAYMRDNYIRGNLEFGQKFGAEELVNQANFNLKETAEEINLAHSLIKELKRTPTPGSGFITVLLTEAQLLPGTYRVHLNDTAVLLATFEKLFTFEMTEIPTEEAGRWKFLQVPPSEAGEWHAYQIPPEEAVQWMGLNLPAIYSASAAARWRFAGFTPETVREWAEQGIPPHISQIWSQAGFKAHTAMDFIRKGTRFPPAPKTE